MTLERFFATLLAVYIGFVLNNITLWLWRMWRAKRTAETQEAGQK